MHPDALPVISGIVHISAHGAIFVLPHCDVEVTAPRKLIQKLTLLCRGNHTITAIREILSSLWPAQSIAELLSALEVSGVLTDSLAQSNVVWRYVKNPPPYSKSLSNVQIIELLDKAHIRHEPNKNGIEIAPLQQSITSIIRARKSVRCFDSHPVGVNKIAGILWAAYGAVYDAQQQTSPRRTVPSGGGLYPLQISLMLCRSCESLAPGVYAVSYGEANKVILEPVDNTENNVKRSFLDQLLIEEATGVVVISGAFQYTEEKYGNRALLYVPLEAGHAAQNILLSATEYGLASIEIGGFLEDALAEALRLPKNYVPLTTVVFGNASRTGASVRASGLDVNWAVYKAGDYVLPFAMAFARPISSGQDWSCGRAISPKLAYRKATAEAWEWVACGNIDRKNLVYNKTSEIGNYIPPTELLRFHRAQYRINKFRYFPWSPEDRCYWAQAQNILTGNSVAILADLIYFPFRDGESKYADANSSGVAAYPNWEGAVERAVFELIERDAFMVAWLNRLPGATISEGSLPLAIQQRLADVRSQGFRISIQDIGLDLGPVFFVIAQSEQHIFTTCSGAASVVAENALERALMEVEASIYCKLQSLKNPVKRLHPADVRLPCDHGLLYEQMQWYKQADFFFMADREANMPTLLDRCFQSWENCIDAVSRKGMNILAVDLGSAENGQLRIARAFIPGLVPMSFGYGEEPCGMERLYSIPVTLGMRRLPLTYGKLNKFPHPYT